MANDVMSPYRAEEQSLAAVQRGERLPWRHCVALMLVGSVVCYGVGYAVVAGFLHLLKVF